jgi:hypothetical protein
MTCCFSILGQTRSEETLVENKNLPINPTAIEKKGKKIVKKNVINNMWTPPSKNDYEAIALNSEDINKYAAYLGTNNSGLIRLHDASKCVSGKNIVNLEEPCPSNFIFGKGTSYSFRTQKYRGLNFSDLQLFNQNLYTVGLNTQGILTKIGDIALDKVSIETNGVKQLHGFVPSSDYTKANGEIKAFFNGVRAGSYIYKKESPVKENETYILRSIAYKGKVIERRGPFKINILDNDKRDDVIVAFRVVRKHEDGSVTLLWKEINRQPAPKLIIEKTEKQNVSKLK